MSSILVPGEQVAALLGHGTRWAQGAWTDGQGNRCIHQGIRECQIVLGDAHLILEVAVLQGWAPQWNDNEDRTWADIERVLVQHREITPEELEPVFGPSWAVVVNAVRRVASLDRAEMLRLAAAVMNDPAAVLEADNAMLDFGNCSAASNAARDASEQVVREYCVTGKPRAAVQDAGLALAVVSSVAHALPDLDPAAQVTVKRVVDVWTRALGPDAFELPDRAFSAGVESVTQAVAEAGDQTHPAVPV
jgi:hypothetical protein